MKVPGLGVIKALANDSAIIDSNSDAGQEGRLRQKGMCRKNGQREVSRKSDLQVHSKKDAPGLQGTGHYTDDAGQSRPKDGNTER